MASTDYHGWPLPDGTDMPFVHLDMAALADAIDKELPIVVPNMDAKDALPPLLNLKVMVASANYKMYVHNGTTWQAAGFVFGHAGRTDGFQTTTGGVRVDLSAAQILSGGVTFSATDDALIVPVAGAYRITAQYYASGSSGVSAIGYAKKNLLSPVLCAHARFWKADSGDFAATGSGIATLAAGDKVTLHMDFASSTWGTSGYDGTFLEVELVG